MIKKFVLCKRKEAVSRLKKLMRKERNVSNMIKTNRNGIGTPLKLTWKQYIGTRTIKDTKTFNDLINYSNVPFLVETFVYILEPFKKYEN